jgi:hypothetical protein
LTGLSKSAFVIAEWYNVTNDGLDHRLHPVPSGFGKLLIKALALSKRFSPICAIEPGGFKLQKGGHGKHGIAQALGARGDSGIVVVTSDHVHDLLGERHFVRIAKLAIWVAIRAASFVAHDASNRVAIGAVGSALGNEFQGKMRSATLPIKTSQGCIFFEFYRLWQLCQSRGVFSAFLQHG